MSPNKEEYPANLNAIARARSVINDFVKTRQTLCAKSVRIPAEGFDLYFH